MVLEALMQVAQIQTKEIQKLPIISAAIVSLAFA
jgi:hypothetical protein